MKIGRTGPSRELAEHLVATAIAEAERIGVAMAVAVCDSGGHLVSFSRVDGTPLLAVQTAPAKARTAVFLRRPTAATVEMARKHPEVYGSFMTASPDFVVLSMGGEPLIVDGEVLGAVASAGGTGAQDVMVSGAALQVWNALVNKGDA